MANYGGPPQDPYGSNPYGAPPPSPPMGDPTDPAYALSQPLRGASIGDAYARFWKKYATFSGRASRSEFWWTFLVNAVIGAILSAISDGGRNGLAFVTVIWDLATLVPSLALGARRLHDTDHSGWWQLIALIPIVGWIILIVWWASGPRQEGVRFDEVRY